MAAAGVEIPEPLMLRFLLPHSLGSPFPEPLMFCLLGETSARVEREQPHQGQGSNHRGLLLGKHR